VVLIDQDRKVHLIRKAETLDYIADNEIIPEHLA
jgi:hypothetical protein